jgi:hypothetical protein
MQKEINKKIKILLFFFAVGVIITGLLTADYGRPTNRWTQAKPISFPEEIYLAEPGDTLIVSKVADSIYIQYK